MEAVETVWVTGASGMLGKTLLKILKGHGALGISRRPAPGGVFCDLADPFQVKRLFKSARPSLVVNCAAYSDVDGCEQDPKTAHECNTLTVKHLAEACTEARVPWIHVSTDYVFDGKKRSPYEEEDATGPVNIYGLTKLGGEFYAHSSGASCAIVRTSWLFGAENPANFVNAMLARLKKEKQVSVLDDQIDCPTHVKDLGEALLKIGAHLVASAAKYPSRAWHDTFHVCNSGDATRFEMTQRMNEWLKLGVSVERVDRSQVQGRVAVRPAYVAMSTAHFEKTFAMKMRPWHESLKEYVSEAARCVS